MEESKELNHIIDVAMLAGTILLQSGSEIHRVEDTMLRIAHAKGILDCNILAMPAAIFFSIENTNISRMKRITHSSYNIERVCHVNQISRKLVAGSLSLEEALEALTQLKTSGFPYTKRQTILAATFCAPFFSIMFGGHFYDALGAALATFFGFTFSLYVDKLIRIPFVTSFAGALVFGLLAQLWVQLTPFHSSADLIIAGAVMPFVPGIALTNAVRDIMTNHINSGMSKLFESLLITLALGAGTSVALILVN
ncbi:threonine/serine exporter family protein [Streptococcus himalayensis]|uniref:Membrane protein n=1 Tax=Streptococcus himalayensis TaxID=1888195 RepID=A0A917EE52_9STRE|nr:threonine/serine exporter family protein [Streptococcus himalayensis]GGE24443.1 membrane protein [Streptococcus himalayensis]